MATPSTQELIETGIRIRLAHLNKSQRWLADEIGMTTHQLSRRMTGKTLFDTDDIDVVAKALGLESMDALLSLPSTEPSDEAYRRFAAVAVTALEHLARNEAA